MRVNHAWGVEERGARRGWPLLAFRCTPIDVRTECVMRFAQKSEERGEDGKAKAGRKRGRTVTDVHQLSEAAARRLSEAQPRPALNGQELAFEGGSFRARPCPHPNPCPCADAGRRRRCADHAAALRSGRRRVCVWADAGGLREELAVGCPVPGAQAPVVALVGTHRALRQACPRSVPAERASPALRGRRSRRALRRTVQTRRTPFSRVPPPALRLMCADVTRRAPAGDAVHRQPDSAVDRRGAPAL